MRQLSRFAEESARVRGDLLGIDVRSPAPSLDTLRPDQRELLQRQIASLPNTAKVKAQQIKAAKQPSEVIQ